MLGSEWQSALDALDRAGLLALRDEFDARLAAFDEEVARAVAGHDDALGGKDEPQQRQAAGLPPKTGSSARNGRGWIETKWINGRPYRYRRWREGQRKRSKYLGPGEA